MKFTLNCCPRSGIEQIFEKKTPKSTVLYKVRHGNKGEKLLISFISVYCFLSGLHGGVNLHLGNERPVCRVWPFLTRSWERQIRIF